ncbi:MAG: hypothetical protein WC953_07610 [Pseudomonas sp.]
MSTMLIVALVVGGLVVVVSIGFFSQAVERARLEKARAIAELQARWSHCNSINASLPGQFMTVELKQLLLNIEASLLEKLLKLDPRNNRHATQLADVRQQLAQGEPQIGNVPVVTNNETAAQAANRQLSDLLQLLDLARTSGVLDDQGFMRWSQQVKRHQLETGLGMYRALAEAAMREGKPRIAKLQYERAVAYLGKQRTGASEQMAVFRHLLLQAEQAVIQMEQGLTGTALSEGVQALEEDDQAWRKKALYDD